MHNISVETLYIPGGIIIPWEVPVIVDDDLVGDDVSIEDTIFYEICLAKPPPNSTVAIDPANNALLIQEKNGNGAMFIPLTLVCGIGKKGNVVLHQTGNIKRH